MTQYCYNDRDQLVPGGGVPAVTYDGLNCTSSIGSTVFGWNALNEHVSTVTGGVQTSFQRDSAGRLLRRTRGGDNVLNGLKLVDDGVASDGFGVPAAGVSADTATTQRADSPAAWFKQEREPDIENSERDRYRILLRRRRPPHHCHRSRCHRSDLRRSQSCRNTLRQNLWLERPKRACLHVYWASDGRY